MNRSMLWLLGGLLLIGGGTAMVTAYKQRGLRNNNPGNIRYSAANHWQGQTGQDSAGFVIFDTPQNGLRAMARLIKNKLGKGKNTIASLIANWAPPNENNTAAYIASVAKETGLTPTTPLTVGHLPALIAAIVRHENGAQPYAPSLIAQAVAAA